MSRTVIGDNGITPLELAKQIQQENQEIPLMVHIGSAPPHLDEILALMEKGDVLTHCFNGKENGILDQATDKIKISLGKRTTKESYLISGMVRIVSIFT